MRREQLVDLKETTKEFVQQCIGLIELSDDKKIEKEPNLTPIGGRIVVVPGLGSFDQAAGELFVSAARLSGYARATCTSPGGLTGISAEAERREGIIKYVAIITVGGVTRRQLDLLSHRAQRDLTPNCLGVFAAADTGRVITQNKAAQAFNSLKSLLRDIAKTQQPVLKAS